MTRELMMMSAGDESVHVSLQHVCVCVIIVAVTAGITGIHLKGGHQPGKRGKVREIKSGTGKVGEFESDREKSGKMCSCLWCDTASTAIDTR